MIQRTVVIVIAIQYLDRVRDDQGLMNPLSIKIFFCDKISMAFIPHWLCILWGFSYFVLLSKLVFNTTPKI